MKKTPSKKPKTRVTHISVDVLYNLGNYEHIKYSVGIDVAKGESAAKALLELKRIMVRLKPVKKPYEYEHYAGLLKKDPRECSEVEKSQVETAAKVVGEYACLKSLQWEAVKALDDIGGASVRKDAKETWQDDDSTPF